MTLADNQQRQQALDVTQSFIVQAPAGSGKTTLLIQRLLKLLEIVDKPENILAITFTKKAANEMRERLIQALGPNNPKHQAVLQQPNRLNIQTIDAFNYRLNQQLPILSRLGAATQIHEDADSLYEQAVSRLLSESSKQHSWQPALQTILLHCDNQFMNVQNLLINLLQKRDQWLPHLYDNERNQRHHLEQALLCVNQETLDKLDRCVNDTDKAMLLSILSFVQIYSDNHPLRAVEHFTLDNTIDSKNAWIAVAELLLTAKNTWRQQFNKKIGLLSKHDDKTVVETAKHYKQLLADMRDSFDKHAALRRLLIECRLLPPTQYSDRQWQLINALMTVLPIAYAQLKVIFSEKHGVDYIENAQAALQALGTDDKPTDLALALDYQLQHILIDEFQDTAISQLRLLEKLTANWQTGDGKTLFIVGDPMQSIYRFRQADVSLFLHVKQFGINTIKPHFLALSSNFRSSHAVIDWINDTFTQAFPSEDNINMAAVSYAPAQAMKSLDGSVHITIDPEQAQHCVAIIKRHLQDSEQRIAILVRAKSHLLTITQALQKAEIAYEAVDLEPLSHLSIIYDAFSLAKAISHLSERTAWLALLRAPFIGLSLDDCLTLSDPQYPTIYDAIMTATVSADGEQRLQVVRSILQSAINNTARGLFCNRIKQLWHALNAHHYYHRAMDQQNLQTFLDVLSQYEHAGSISDWPNCQRAINRAFAKSQRHNRLQLMTMHKSKGLEFDVVILPELDRGPANQQQALLLWQERLLANDHTDLLLAPLKAKTEKSCQLYDYIKSLEERKRQLEATRLLYVACTRAKQHLYLLAGDVPRKRSLLASIWQTAKTQAEIIENDTEKKTVINVNYKRFITDIFNHKSVLRGQTPKDRFSAALQQQANMPDNWQEPSSRHIGTLVHLLLQCVAENGFDWWQQRNKANFIRLQGKQCLQSLNDEQVTMICNMIDATINDPHGHWILQPHPTHHCEFSLGGIYNNEVQQIIIDRWFIDESGQAWIIDYKTILGDALDIDAELAKYQEQLAIYQQLLSQYLMDPADKPRGVDTLKSRGVDAVKPQDTQLTKSTFHKPIKSTFHEPIKSTFRGLSAESNLIKCALYFPAQQVFAEATALQASRDSTSTTIK